VDALYPWVKAFHIIAVISWMAGLLYLPRLFVYHSECDEISEKTETFKIMERRLLKAIMTPAMVVSWLLGLTLLLVFDAVSFSSGGWFHAKLALVIMLSIFHMYLSRLVRKFADNDNPHTTRFYRLLNEVPTVLMVGIVILVIVRPF
jgi:protoporphyrinogen IX oxidase